MNVARWLRFARTYAVERDVPETLEMQALLLMRPPKVVVELGFRLGATATYWAETRPLAMITVSYPAQRDVEACPHASAACYVQKALCQMVPHCYHLEGHSARQVPVVDSLLRSVIGRRIDFLFIDAGHSIREVRDDLEAYLPLMEQGGMIGFHDIRMMADDGPRTVWAEIQREEHPSLVVMREFARCQDRYGIGVAQVRN